MTESPSVFTGRKQEVNKALADLEQTLNPTDNIPNAAQQNGRGLNVYTMSQLMGISGRTQSGERVHGYYDQSLFYLTYDERIAIYRLCAPVNAVVTSRMNTIANMEFEITGEKEQEDEIYEGLKIKKAVYSEFFNSSSVPHRVAAGLLLREIQKYLIDVLPDLSNFDTSVMRWYKKIQAQTVKEAEWIKDWLLQPNQQDRYEEMVKKMTFDLMIHGALALYKQDVGGKLENFHVLPGGTVMPLKQKYVGGNLAFVQVTNNVDEPLIYYPNEIAYANYMPTSARSYGFIPLEALINKIAETLLFDRLMADQADGTKPPEKMIIVTSDSPMGGLGEIEIPLNQGEQKRLEAKVNQPKKNAVVTFSGNKATVVDLSRENTMEIQMMREKDIINIVGMVFQATPLEMNLAGSEDTSGRSTAEVQADTLHSRAVKPIIQIIKNILDREILPFRFGPGWHVNYQVSKNDKEEMELLQTKMATGVYAVNEIRKNDLNLEPFPDRKYDMPPDAGGAPDGSAVNPLNMRNME
jgi:hypothetical protein